MSGIKYNKHIFSFPKTEYEMLGTKDGYRIIFSDSGYTYVFIHAFKGEKELNVSVCDLMNLNEQLYHFVIKNMDMIKEECVFGSLLVMYMDRNNFLRYILPKMEQVYG